MTDQFMTGWDPEQLKAMQDSLTCPDCRAPMELRDGQKGVFYGCTTFPLCKTTHPAYRTGANIGRPIGRPAPKAVRDLRRKIMELAAQRWPEHTEIARRKELERYAARRLVIPRAQAAIFNLKPDQLARLVELLHARAAQECA